MKKEIMSALGAFKSVSNFDAKPNQFEVRFENGHMFMSYDSIIIVSFFYREEIGEHSNKVYLGDDWNYSRTTSKYRNKFLNRDTEWFKKAIKSGEITVIEGL